MKELTCKNCGAPLTDSHTLKCEYCGTSYIDDKNMYHLDTQALSGVLTPNEVRAIFKQPKVIREAVWNNE